MRVKTRQIDAARRILHIALLAWTALGCQGNAAGGPGGTPIDTVFVEGFESGDLSRWEDGVDASKQRVVTDPSFAQEGSRYLEVTYVAGGDGGWLTRWFMPGYDSLFVSYYVRFEPTWVGLTKLVALYGSRTDDQWSAMGQAGICPNGTDFFADADDGGRRSRRDALLYLLPGNGA